METWLSIKSRWLLDCHVSTLKLSKSRAGHKLTPRDSTNSKQSTSFRETDYKTAGTGDAAISLILIFLAQVESVRAVLKKDLDLPLAEIADPNARLDGGDVLFTGKKIEKKLNSI